MLKTNWTHIKYKTQAAFIGSACVLFGTLMGNRTPDSAVRGRRLNRLTMRAYRVCLVIIA